MNKQQVVNQVNYQITVPDGRGKEEIVGVSFTQPLKKRVVWIIDRVLTNFNSGIWVVKQEFVAQIKKGKTGVGIACIYSDCFDLHWFLTVLKGSFF